MPRPKQTVPSATRNIALPQPLADKLDLELYSELEGRIPTGAYKSFFSNLLEQYFAAQQTPCQHCRGTGVKALA
jgi:threonine synthase